MYFTDSDIQKMSQRALSKQEAPQRESGDAPFVAGGATHENIFTQSGRNHPYGQGREVTAGQAFAPATGAGAAIFHQQVQQCMTLE